MSQTYHNTVHFFGVFLVLFGAPLRAQELVDSASVIINKEFYHFIFAPGALGSTSASGRVRQIVVPVTFRVVVVDGLTTLENNATFP